MDTDSTWFAVLVIILSSFLALFLLLSIVVLVKVVQIVKIVKRIVEQAEDIADRAEHIASFFEKTTTPMAFVRLFSNISEAIQKKAKRKK